MMKDGDMDSAIRLRQLGSLHPRLHFTTAGLPAMRERAGKSHARYARLLLDWVAAHADWEPRTAYPFTMARTTEVELEESGIYVTNAALAYVISHDRDHLDLARRWALMMCEVPQGSPDNYGFGLYVAGLARAYDWLHDDLEPPERARIRDHIARVVRLLYLGSFAGTAASHWWAEAQLHHDHWVATGGYGEAALAIAGEVDEAEIWAIRAMEEFKLAFSWLGDDGAWQEGAADWCYALAPLLWFFGAWQTAAGEDPHDVAWLHSTARYRLYHWLPDDSYIYTNDSFRSGRYNTSGSAACHLLRRLASLYRDGHAQWLAERDEAFDLKPGPKGVPQAAYEGSSLARNWPEYPDSPAFCAAWNFLWFDPGVKATAPGDLPGAHHFANQGVAVLRSGWDDAATVASFSCGPLAGHHAAERLRSGEERGPSNFSHAHLDYNAFTLFAQGCYFIVPPGYARRDSRFQNTITVNGAHLSFDPGCRPRILAFTVGPGYRYALGDATDAFPDQLHVRRYRRHMLMLPPDWLVLFDDVRLGPSAPRTWNRLEWAVHSDPQECLLAISGPTATWRSVKGEDGPEIKLRVLEPSAFAWERSLFSSLVGEPLLEGLRLSVPEWYQPVMRVLSVWRCTKGPMTVERLEGEGGSAVALDRDDGRWVVVFCHDAPRQAHKPLVSYRYADPHHLLMLGLSGSLREVGIARGQEDVHVEPAGHFQVNAGGWLEATIG
jgi:hypothetical protein